MARSARGCRTLTGLTYNVAAVPYAGFTSPARADISIRGTRGSNRTQMVDIRGWKVTESRPRSWRERMSTYTSDAGTRLAGRYRLVDQTAAGSGWIMWKAVDETLARSVSVLTFAPGFPRIPDVVTAARAASRLTDPRLAQVFDVEDGGDQAYIVMEWVSGESLADLVAEGPLNPARACALILEASRALAGAHAAGLAH